jgi:hypothetical protein
VAVSFSLAALGIDFSVHLRVDRSGGDDHHNQEESNGTHLLLNL